MGHPMPAEIAADLYALAVGFLDQTNIAARVT
jgi:hypothetical protein